MKSTHLPTISIGIPTYEAGRSLVKTLDSIYNQSAWSQIKEVIVVVDGSSSAKARSISLSDRPKLKVVHKRVRRGQSARINDLFQLASGELLILTNDDVTIDAKAVEKITTTYLRQKSDLIAGNVQPQAAEKFLEAIISVGSRLNSGIASRWRKSNNYLSCNGRLIALSRRLYRRVRLPNQLWNNDAYLYLFTQVNGLRFNTAPQAEAFYRSPLTFDEHLKQSSRFQISLTENQHYFTTNLAQHYDVPGIYINLALRQLFWQEPVMTTLYLGLYLITRLWSKRSFTNHQAGYWFTDVSTKRL